MQRVMIYSDASPHEIIGKVVSASPFVAHQIGFRDALYTEIGISYNEKFEDNHLAGVNIIKLPSLVLADKGSDITLRYQTDEELPVDKSFDRTYRLSSVKVKVLGREVEIFIFDNRNE